MGKEDKDLTLESLYTFLFNHIYIMLLYGILFAVSIIFTGIVKSLLKSICLKPENNGEATGSDFP